MSEPAASDANLFAELREQFHVFVEMGADAREQALDALRVRHPALAMELAGLLDAVDERDLRANVPSIPSRIGPFRVLERLGTGGMGEVFLAERADAAFEQRVAVKVMRAHALSLATNARFLRERQILARLSHHDIAHLIDGGVGADGVPWIAMEYVDGLALGEWLRATRPCLDARVALLQRLCSAVAYAHGHLIVHRDLKPGNVLVTADGSPKLLDFGIAKLLDDTDAEATRTGMHALTLRYAAPEQILGDRVSTVTDVYALGVLLYELLCEASPHAQAARGTGGWAQAILHEPPPPLSAPSNGSLTPREQRRLGGDLERIVHKAMARSPSDRYAGAAMLADDLSDWRADRPLRSGVGSRREQIRKFLRRRRWPIALAASVVLALGVGLLLALHEAHQAEQQRRVAEGNLAAVLGVLGAANPNAYAVAEPRASEFLIRAAASIEEKSADNPLLIARALGEIGNGLLNLGHSEEAEPILVAAIAALDRQSDVNPALRLSLYKLQIFSQDEPAARDRAIATARQIARVVELPGVPVDSALDALGSAGSVLSKHGQFDLVAAVFAQADRLPHLTPEIDQGKVENYWRQRGWAAWRAYDLAAAADYLTQSAQIMAAAPANFAPMRRAEVEGSLAEIEAARGNDDAMRGHLQNVLPLLEHNYPADHPQHTALELQRARLNLLQQRPDLAIEAIDPAIAAVRAANTRGGTDLRRALWIRAESLARLDRCAEARRAVQDARSSPNGLEAELPRDRALDEANATLIVQRCGTD